MKENSCHPLVACSNPAWNWASAPAPDRIERHRGQFTTGRHSAGDWIKKATSRVGKAPRALLVCRLPHALEKDPSGVTVVQHRALLMRVAEQACQFAGWGTHADGPSRGRPLGAKELPPAVKEGFELIGAVADELRWGVARNWPHLSGQASGG
jgi:hypothetical protein